MESVRTAVLYARVSTEEQADRGYSLGQQMEALRGWAASEGYTILEEVQDAGWSGASLTRPGLDRVRDLVEAGGVGVVLAQDADRISRDPMHRGLLDQEMEHCGTRLFALDDWGDDSHEGEMLRYMKGWVSKGERLKMAERSRRNLMEKARRGEVIRGPKPPYGFTFEQDAAGKDVLIVHEPTMQVVRYIFRLLAVEGASQHSLRDRLEAEGIEAPSGRRWNTTTLRNIVRSDLYKPHSYEEVVSLVSSEVAAKLDKEEQYGLWTWNRRKTNKQAVSEPGPSRSVHRHRYTVAVRSADEWIYVPTVDPTVPREHVETARATITSRRRPSGAAQRFWVLSGGLIECEECESKMSPHTVKSDGRTNYYYSCRQRYNNPEHPCGNGKSVRADEAEEFVWNRVFESFTKPDSLRKRFDELIEHEKKAMRGDPEKEARRWMDKLSEIDGERQNYIRLSGRGRISDAELDRELDRLDVERRTAEQELEAVRGRSSRIEELEANRDRLFSQWTGNERERLESFTLEERRTLYQQLGLRLDANRNGISAMVHQLGVYQKAEEVCGSESTSWRTL